MTKLFGAVLMAMMLLAGRADASDTKWLAMAAAGHAADYASSVWFSNNGSVCVEGNPWARHPDETFDARKGAIGVGISVAAEWTVLKLTRHSPNPNVKMFGKTFVIGMGTYGFGMAAMNVAHCRNGGR